MARGKLNKAGQKGKLNPRVLIYKDPLVKGMARRIGKSKTFRITDELVRKIKDPIGQEAVFRRHIAKDVRALENIAKDKGIPLHEVLMHYNIAMAELRGM